MAAQRDPVAVPWAPEDLPVAPQELASWAYVVLEEIVDDVCLLRRWPWPVVDQLGRLSWPDSLAGDDGELTIDLDALRAQLYAPNDIERRPRVGDVFGVERTSARWRGGHVTDLREVFRGRIFDIAADARLAAKIAYQAGLSTVRPPGDEDRPLMAAVRTSLAQQSATALVPLRIRTTGPGPARGRS